MGLTLFIYVKLYTHTHTCAAFFSQGEPEPSPGEIRGLTRYTYGCVVCVSQGEPEPPPSDIRVVQPALQGGGDRQERLRVVRWPCHLRIRNGSAQPAGIYIAKKRLIWALHTGVASPVGGPPGYAPGVGMHLIYIYI